MRPYNGSSQDMANAGGSARRCCEVSVVMRVKIDLFVDYVCPFCFLVAGAVETLKRERDVTIEIMPFELRPDPVPTLRPEDAYLPNVWQRAVYPHARRCGVAIRLPSVSPQPRTARAYMVLQLAQERHLGEAYSAAMFKAFFQQDRDIGRDDVIVEVASAAGLAADEVRAALASDRRRLAQQEAQRYATQDAGVRVVPSFRVNGQLVEGSRSAEELVHWVDRVQAAKVAV